MKTRIFSKVLPFFLFIFIAACSATDTNQNSNLANKNPADPAAGGVTWGENDPKTGKHKPEATNLEIIKRQEEVLKRQESEIERLRKEKEDILRQKYYNEKQKAVN